MAEQVETPAATPAPSPTPEAKPAAIAPKPNGAVAEPVSDQPLALGGGEAEKVVPPAQMTAENWRDVMAGGDAKTVQYLSRYASPANVAKALLAMRQKMDAGEIIRSKPEGDPNDPAIKQALNEWRAQANVPQTPEGYLEKVPDGLVFGEADKPILTDFLKDMHGKDAPPAYVHAALQWYKAREQQTIADRAEADKQGRTQSEDALRSKWGPDYRGNMNGAASLFTTYGSKDLATRFFSARMADGTPLGDDPATLEMLVAISRELNPSGTVVPAPGQTTMQSITSELAQLRIEMSDTKGKQYDYWKNEAKQARFRELVQVEEKIKSRAA